MNYNKKKNQTDIKIIGINIFVYVVIPLKNILFISV